MQTFNPSTPEVTGGSSKFKANLVYRMNIQDSQGYRDISKK